MNLSNFQRKYAHCINRGMSIGSINALTDVNFDYDVFLPSKQMNLQRGLVWNRYHFYIR